MEGERRLIDANVLIEEINQQRRANRTSFPRKSYVVGDVLTSIYNAPTVDAVEVVHGQWIAVPSSDMMTGKAYCCSECKRMRYGSFMPNYCSNCGAKMDGGADNGI